MVFDTVVPEIVFEAPDYSRVVAVAGKKVKPLRAVYISASEISQERLESAAANLVDGNALMIEMKPRSGQLMGILLPRWLSAMAFPPIMTLQTRFRL